MSKTEGKKKAAAAKDKTGKAETRGRPRKHPAKPVKTELELLMEQNRKDLRAPQFTRKFPLPLVFICSSFSGDRKTCLEKAKRYARFAVSRFCVPVTTHLMYPHYLRTEVEYERQIGFYCGLCLLDKCAELWIFGEVETSDMEWEIWRANMRNKTIRWYTEDLKEVHRELPERCRSLSEPVVKARKKDATEKNEKKARKAG